MKYDLKQQRWAIYAHAYAILKGREVLKRITRLKNRVTELEIYLKSDDAQPPRKKQDMSVINALRIFVNDLPVDFAGIDVVRQVAFLVGRPNIFASTVTRKMRLLRSKGEFNFICVDPTRSLYRRVRYENEYK